MKDKIKQTNTKLLVIAITAVAILAAITTTTSIGGAKPAFAAVNCDGTLESLHVECSGGSSFGDRPGGSGGHTVLDVDSCCPPNSFTFTNSGGGGGVATDEETGGTSAGGSGQHRTCDTASGCQAVGGGGGHAIPSD